MTCAASVPLEATCPENTTEYSDEGTAAHALAAMCLTEVKEAEAFKGRRLVVVNGVYWPGAPAAVPPKLRGHTEEIKNIFEVDDDMVENVQCYLDNIHQYVNGENDLFVEQALPIGHLTGEEGATGTGDAIILADNGVELQVHDLKYGRGNAVSPVENKQLMTYALGALKLAEVLGYEPTRVRLVIHQPRIIRAPQEWTLSVKQLVEEFMPEVEKGAERADAAQVCFDNHEGFLADHYYSPSDEACKWCKAKADCKALAAFVQETVGADFAALVEQQPNYRAVAFTETPNDLGAKLDAVDLIEDWCKAVRTEAERRLVNGEPVPSPKGGYKLVQGKKGRRAWSLPEAVEAQFKKWRIKIEQMYEFKLISPTTAEKLLKKAAPKRWEALQAEIVQAEGKPHVALMSDAREALAVTAPGSEFEPIPEVTAEDLC